MISYISTRGAQAQDFKTVLLSGLAPDGGLYVPETWPQLKIKSLKGKSYNEIAEAVMYPFVKDCFDHPLSFRERIYQIYHKDNFPGGVAPLVEIYPGLHVMELFHGPTLAFKDVALQMLGALFDEVLLNSGKYITIIGATSGDTGSAAIEGCRHSQMTEIFILYPHGRVSEVQRRQMTTVNAPNVHCIAVEGTFDDCQNLVKAMFADEAFRKEKNLAAVNSINWARILAQIVYYVYASLQYPGASFVVPTGNFGNVFAAYAAKKMGAPLGDLVIATNRNDILTRFFETGEMKMEGVTPTLSPSMDIQISSNFERYLFELMDRDAKSLGSLMKDFRKTGSFRLDPAVMQKARKEFAAFRCDEKQMLETMKKVYQEAEYLLDPHSAVGFAAALDMKKKTGAPVIALATAHPAKFPDAVEQATGIRPDLPDHLGYLLQKPEVFEILPTDFKLIQSYIRRN